MHNLASGRGAEETQVAARALSAPGKSSSDDGPNLPPDDPNLYIRWAEQAIGREEFHVAGRHVDRALELSPENGRAWALRGQLNEFAGREEEAIAAYHRAVSCGTQNPAAALRLATLQLDQERSTQSALILRSVIDCPSATDAQRSQAQWLLGVAYVKMARWEQAVATLDEAAKTRNLSTDDWYLIATARYRAGDLAGARRDVEQQLALHPRHGGFATLLADLNAMEKNRGPILPATNLVAPNESPAVSTPP